MGEFTFRLDFLEHFWGDGADFPSDLVEAGVAGDHLPWLFLFTPLFVIEPGHP